MHDIAAPLSIDAAGYLLVDGARVSCAHPGPARGTDCLTAHYWTAGEWDCGCIDPLCLHDGVEDASACPWGDFQGG